MPPPTRFVLDAHDAAALLDAVRTVDVSVVPHSGGHDPGTARRWSRVPVVPVAGDPPTILLVVPGGVAAVLTAAGTVVADLPRSDTSLAPVSVTCAVAATTATAGVEVVTARVVAGAAEGDRPVAPRAVTAHSAVERTHDRARELVLLRHYAPGSSIEPADLAFDLQSDLPAAASAMAQLSADGLVRRDPVRGYVVVPYDVRTSDETFDARCVIELGVLETSLEDADPHLLAGLRGSYEAMADELVGGRFVDFDRYLAANIAFHEQVVMLAGSLPLKAAFDHLGLKEVMTRSFGSTRESSESFLDTQRGMLEAIEGRDLVAARAATVAYRDLAKQRVRAILSQTGGLL